MIFTAPDPVASGQRFDVLYVHGRTPHSLDDFLGDAAFTLRWDAQDRLVTGCGHRNTDTVRFTEKDGNHGCKDIQTWSIEVAAQTGRFTAQTTR